MLKDFVYSFSKENDYARKINVSEELILKTRDCFDNQVENEDQLITEIDMSKANPATGPLYVNGAEKGDCLLVDILDIKVADQGAMVAMPGFAPIEKGIEARTKLIKLEDGFALFNDLKIPINPMIGVIGTSPDGEPIPCGMPGFHGGNMDNKKIVKGTRLYLPVHVEGALLQIGDLHAVMGDGEICGTGLEIQGEVKIKVDLLKDFSLERPVLEDDDFYYTIATDLEFSRAQELASRDMHELLMKAYDWDATDTLMYMSLQGNTEICQSCKPSEMPVVVRFSVPKIAGKPLIK